MDFLMNTTAGVETISKVAEVTIFFWIMKILATTLGGLSVGSARSLDPTYAPFV